MAETRTDVSTVGLSGTFDWRGWQREERSPGAVPALTVLFHPDVRRVGEWTALSEILLGREALVSRNHPDFTSPDRLPGGPLADRHLSRRPIQFQPGPEKGVVLSVGESRTRVEADGAPVLGSHELSAADDAAAGLGDAGDQSGGQPDATARRRARPRRHRHRPRGERSGG